MQHQERVTSEMFTHICGSCHTPVISQFHMSMSQVFLVDNPNEFHTHTVDLF